MRSRLTFLALLYLALVRRVGTWLAPEIPPEASAAVLLFLLSFYRTDATRIGKAAARNGSRETDRVQRLMAEIQQQARQGNAEKLAGFIETRVKETFELAAVRVNLRNEPSPASRRGSVSARFFLSEGKISEPFGILGNVAGLFACNPTARFYLEKLARAWSSCVSNCRRLSIYAG